MYSLDGFSLTSHMKGLNCGCTDDLACFTTPLIIGVGRNQWINNGFVSGDLTINGLIGNGSSKYLQTGIIPSTTFGAANAGLSVYVPIAYVAANAGSDFGAADGGFTDTIEVGPTVGGNTAYWASFNYGSGAVTYANSAGFVGFFSGNRTGSAATNLYLASSTHAFASAASGSSSGGTLSGLTYELMCFARNFAGTANQFSAHRVSFWAAHDGLVSSDCQNFYNAVQQMKVDQGGGYA